MGEEYSDDEGGGEGGGGHVDFVHGLICQDIDELTSRRNVIGIVGEKGIGSGGGSSGGGRGEEENVF